MIRYVLTEIASDKKYFIRGKSRLLLDFLPSVIIRLDF